MEATTMSKRGKETVIQVVPQSGKAPKGRQLRVTLGMTVQQALEAAGMSAQGKTLSFGGKPVAMGDVLYSKKGQKFTGGNVLTLSEHAAGS
jgi:hypothetical protein